MRALTRMLGPLAALWQDRADRPHKRRKKRRKHRAHTPVDPKVASLEKLVVEEIEVADATPLIPVAAPKPKRRFTVLPAARVIGTWVGLWLLLVLAALSARSPWPLDETRVLAVAWEMWTRGTLVPHLNGQPYLHAPPLLYWTIVAAWKLFGLSEWWARLVPPLFGLGSLALMGVLARYLWPDQRRVARYAPILMLGTACWAAYLSFALPDMLVVFFVLLAAVGMAAMWRGQHRRGWLLLGSALAGGILASGLAVFVYVAPAAVLAPLWAKGSGRVGAWYADLAKATGLGLGLGMAMLLIFGGAFGGAHLDALLRSPLPGPAVEFFDASRPWWWYLALLPVLGLPWSVFPLVWMRAWHIRREPLDPGFAFCLFWAWSAVAWLSLLDVKQPQFLLPVLPAFVLGMAYLLFNDELADHGSDSVLSSMGFPLVVIGGVLAAVPGLPRVEALPDALWEMRTAFIGLALAGIGILMAWLPLLEVRQRIMNITMGGGALLVIAVLALGSQFDKLYAVDKIANDLAAAQRQQRPIAHVGPYDGQFHFVGRLRAPLVVVAPDAALGWCADNPQGLLVTYTESWRPQVAGLKKPVFEAAFRDQRIHVWEARTVVGGN